MTTLSDTQIFERVYCGIDFGHNEHQVCVFVPALQDEHVFVVEQRIRNRPADIAALCHRLRALVGGRRHDIQIGIESAHELIVDELLSFELDVRVINPRKVDTFRQRESIAGAKDDQRDARCIARALYTDAYAFSAIEALDEHQAQLRIVNRRIEELTRSLTAAGNQLREVLRQYFPSVLELDLDRQWLLKLLLRCPRPRDIEALDDAELADILKRYRVRRASPDKLRQRLAASSWRLSDGLEQALSHDAVCLIERILQIRDQLREHNARRSVLLDTLSAKQQAQLDEAGLDGVSAIESLRSLPGAGDFVIATLVTEAGGGVLAHERKVMRQLAGVAPVRSTTGKKQSKGQGRVSMRRACNKRLRNGCHHLARCAVRYEPGARARYQQMRDRGVDHNQALRQLADGLFKVIYRLLRDRSRFDPEHSDRASRQPVTD